jgi:hypothetical protein
MAALFDGVGTALQQLSPLIDWVATASLGILVAISDLISRYRDAPSEVLSKRPAHLYLIVNAAATVAALFLIRSFGWTFGAPNPQATSVAQVLVAGLGAITLFRTSLNFVGPSGDKVEIGLSKILQDILSAADRAVDRHRASIRANAVRQIMEKVSFTKASVSLPAYCIALMQNLSQVDEERLRRQVTAIIDTKTDDRLKAHLLGLIITDAIGTDVLQRAVEAIGHLIAIEEAVEASMARPASSHNGESPPVLTLNRPGFYGDWDHWDTASRSGAV